LSSPPRFHLVAVSETAEAWRGFFKYDQPVEIVPPLPPPELAALTAQRAAAEDLRTNCCRRNTLLVIASNSLTGCGCVA